MGNFENNKLYKCSVIGEPQLGKRGLYPTLSTKNQEQDVSFMMNVISFCDGKHSVLDIALLLNKEFNEVSEMARVMEEHGILLNSGNSLP